MMMNSMGTNQLLPQNLVTQQQQQQVSQQDHQEMNHFQNGSLQNGPALASLLRQNNQMQGIMNMGGMNMNHGMGGGNQQAMVAMMNNQAAGNMGGMGMNNFNINDLKRLQQLQAQLQSVTPNNSLFHNQASSFGQDTAAANWQNYLDQKLHSSRADDSLRNQLGMNGMIGQVNPLLGSNLFQERMMMNQPSVMNGGFNKPLRADGPLPTLYPLLPRDKTKRMRGGVIEPFPERLHRLLLEVEAAGRSDVISFVADGRAFAIHKPDKLIRVSDMLTPVAGSNLRYYGRSHYFSYFSGYRPSLLSPKPSQFVQASVESLWV